MAKQYDKNLQIINNLDIQFNIFRDKKLKMSVLKNFVTEFSKTSGQTYTDEDIDMICEALEFLDVVIIDDKDETVDTVSGEGISYNDIELELNELLNPRKPDFSELARTRSSAELCRLILDNPENYMKVMYAIRKQL